MDCTKHVCGVNQTVDCKLEGPFNWRSNIMNDIESMSCANVICPDTSSASPLANAASTERYVHSRRRRLAASSTCNHTERPWRNSDHRIRDVCCRRRFVLVSTTCPEVAFREWHVQRRLRGNRGHCMSSQVSNIDRAPNDIRATNSGQVFAVVQAFVNIGAVEQGFAKPQQQLSPASQLLSGIEQVSQKTYEDGDSDQQS